MCGERERERERQTEIDRYIERETEREYYCLDGAEWRRIAMSSRLFTASQKSLYMYVYILQLHTYMDVCLQHTHTCLFCASLSAQHLNDVIVSFYCRQLRKSIDMSNRTILYQNISRWEGFKNVLFNT